MYSRWRRHQYKISHRIKRVVAWHRVSHKWVTTGIISPYNQLWALIIREILRMWHNRIAFIRIWFKFRISTNFKRRIAHNTLRLFKTIRLRIADKLLLEHLSSQLTLLSLTKLTKNLQLQLEKRIYKHTVRSQVIKIMLWKTNIRILST